MVGRCWEAGGAPAYWPWVQSLRELVRESDPTRCATARPRRGALAQIAARAARALPDFREPPTLESRGARFRLFEAASPSCAAARRGPLVLVLDDLHAADEPSLLLLRFLAREIGRQQRCWWSCAFRDVDPTLRDPLSRRHSPRLARERPRLATGLGSPG